MENKLIKEPLNKQCTKFNCFYHFESDLRIPVVYMHLKEKGVPKKSARKFCSKNLCRNDSTKKLDGPSKFRILKIKQEDKPTFNVEKIFVLLEPIKRDGK